MLYFLYLQSLNSFHFEEGEYEDQSLISPIVFDIISPCIVRAFIINQEQLKIFKILL